VNWTIVRRRTVTQHTAFSLLAVLLTWRLRTLYPLSLALLQLLWAICFRVSWRFLTKVITTVALLKIAYSSLYPLLLYFLPALVSLRRLILFYCTWRSATCFSVAVTSMVSHFVVSPSAAIAVFSIILHLCSLFMSLTTSVVSCRLLVCRRTSRSPILKELDLTQHSYSASCLLLYWALNRHKHLLSVRIMLRAAESNLCTSFLH